jgi:hypothetical protein
VRIGAGETGSLRSLDFDRDGNYEKQLNCQWMFTGQDGKNLRMTFSRSRSYDDYFGGPMLRFLKYFCPKIWQKYWRFLLKLLVDFAKKNDHNISF